MRTWSYEATDATGQTVRGTIQAASQGDAAQQLSAQGLTVSSIIEHGTTAVGPPAPPSPTQPATPPDPQPSIFERLAARLANFRHLGAYAFASAPGITPQPTTGGVRPTAHRPAPVFERLARRVAEFRTAALQPGGFPAPTPALAAPTPPAPNTSQTPGVLERLARRIAAFHAHGATSIGSPAPIARTAPSTGTGPFGHLAARLSTPEAAGAGRAIGHSIGEAAMRLFPAFRKVADESRRLAESFADVRRKSNWLNERNPSHQSLLGRLNELSRDRLISGRHRQQAADAAAHLHATVTRAGQFGRRAGQARRTADRLAQQAAERQRIAGDATQRAGRLRHAMRRAGQRLRGASTMHRAARTHLQHAGAVFQRAQQRRQAVVTARHQMANARQGLQAAQLTGNPQQIAAARQAFQQARQHVQQARANFNPQNIQQAGAHFRRAQQRAGHAARMRRQALGQFGAARNRFRQGAAGAGRQHAAATTASQRAAQAMQQFTNLRNRAKGMGARAQTARHTASAMARSFTSSTMTTGAIMALGKAGGLAGTAIALFAKETIEAVKRLRVFAEKVNASNRELARWNGGLAVAFARLDYHDVRRNIWMGAMTEKTAVDLTKSIDRMRNDWQRTERAQRNISNVMASFGAKISGYFGAKSGPFGELAERVITNDRVQKGADALGWAAPRIVPILGAFDLLSRTLDRINKWLDKNGLMPIPGGGNAPDLTAWESFLVGARDGRFGGPLNRPRIDRNGRAIIGGDDFVQVVPGRPQGRRKGRPGGGRNQNNKP